MSPSSSNTNGERCARLALTTKDENGDVKLAGEAVIAI